MKIRHITENNAERFEDAVTRTLTSIKSEHPTAQIKIQYRPSARSANGSSWTEYTALIEYD